MGVDPDPDCPHLSFTGLEGPANVLPDRRWPLLWACCGCGQLQVSQGEDALPLRSRLARPESREGADGSYLVELEGQLREEAADQRLKSEEQEYEEKTKHAYAARLLEAFADSARQALARLGDTVQHEDVRGHDDG